MCRDVKHRDPAPHCQDPLLPGIAPLIATLDVSPTNGDIFRASFALPASYLRFEFVALLRVPSRYSGNVAKVSRYHA